jgi:hypothetical protein
LNSLDDGAPLEAAEQIPLVVLRIVTHPAGLPLIIVAFVATQTKL